MGTVRAAALALALACLGTVAVDTSSALAADAPWALSSAGVGTAAQQVAVDEGSRIVAPDGELTTRLDVDGIGTYDLTSGGLVFHPALGFTGAHGVLLRTADGSDTTYTPSVTPPAPPSAPALSASGPYGQQAHCLISVPEQGRAVLIDHAAQPTLDAVDGTGEFTADPATGVVTFAPAGGFTGSAAIGYRVTDAYGQSASGACTVTIAAAPVQEQLVAAPPTASRVRTRGAAHRQQVVRVDVPAGGTASLVDAGAETLHVYRPGQGSYAFDPATATITFTPSAGFHGVGSVTYRVTDSYGRSAQNAYTPTVLVSPKRPRTAHALGRLA